MTNKNRHKVRLLDPLKEDVHRGDIVSGRVESVSQSAANEFDVIVSGVPMNVTMIGDASATEMVFKIDTPWGTEHIMFDTELEYLLDAKQTIGMTVDVYDKSNESGSVSSNVDKLRSSKSRSSSMTGGSSKRVTIPPIPPNTPDDYTRYNRRNTSISSSLMPPTPPNTPDTPDDYSQHNRFEVSGKGKPLVYAFEKVPKKDTKCSLFVLKDKLNKTKWKQVMRVAIPMLAIVSIIIPAFQQTNVIVTSLDVVTDAIVPCETKLVKYATAMNAFLLQQYLLAEGSNVDLGDINALLLNQFVDLKFTSKLNLDKMPLLIDQGPPEMRSIGRKKTPTRTSITPLTIDTKSQILSKIPTRTEPLFHTITSQAIESDAPTGGFINETLAKIQIMINRTLTNTNDADIPAKDWITTARTFTDTGLSAKPSAPFGLTNELRYGDEQTQVKSPQPVELGTSLRPSAPFGSTNELRFGDEASIYQDALHFIYPVKAESVPEDPIIWKRLVYERNKNLSEFGKIVGSRSWVTMNTPLKGIQSRFDPHREFQHLYISKDANALISHVHSSLGFTLKHLSDSILFVLDSIKFEYNNVPEFYETGIYNPKTLLAEMAVLVTSMYKTIGFGLSETGIIIGDTTIALGALGVTDFNVVLPELQNLIAQGYFIPSGATELLSKKFIGLPSFNVGPPNMALIIEWIESCATYCRKQVTDFNWVGKSSAVTLRGEIPATDKVPAIAGMNAAICKAANKYYDDVNLMRLQTNKQLLANPLVDGFYGIDMVKPPVESGTYKDLTFRSIAILDRINKHKEVVETFVVDISDVIPIKQTGPISTRPVPTLSQNSAIKVVSSSVPVNITESEPQVASSQDIKSNGNMQVDTALKSKVMKMVDCYKDPYDCTPEQLLDCYNPPYNCDYVQNAAQLEIINCYVDSDKCNMEQNIQCTNDVKNCDFYGESNIPIKWNNNVYDYNAYINKGYQPVYMDAQSVYTGNPVNQQYQPIHSAQGAQSVPEPDYVFATSGRQTGMRA